ncbi:glutamine synthetase family protein [Tropicimonas sp. TH_r6]|uniref:glutamine synthetase family protein n=1 Tax=Tropicimonas sp. TH_r6 TaxID=3082085 RepID=UPI002952BF3B|nr:glutamine synthetase family protein [Tropicimonas sp. TH_r6]MDV7144490.1 glutamine synthetase family protein [Tropicimonas sp. TH_r6]
MVRALIDRLPEAAQAYLHHGKLEEVECVIADLAGVARGKAMPGLKFARQTHFYMPNSVFLQTITGDWTEIDGMPYTEPDMVLTPDLSTATAAPWTADWTLQIIHEIADQEGNPVPTAPRNVLKRVVGLFEAQGLTPIVAPELEFYLVAPNTDPAKEVEPPMGRSGRRAAARQAYSLSAIDEYGPVIDDIYDFAEAQGIEIDGIMQEGGAGQVELNMRHGDPVRLADEIFFFKRLIREAALRHNCYATFMAKPIQNEPGSAMHIHHSVVESASGRNIFTDATGQDSETFLHFIGGLQRHMPSIIALIAPYVNSYRRYVPDFAAPINLEWGRDNRTTGLRVPVSSPHSRRVENRLAGMDCNPYLAIAGSLACGWLGMREKRPPAAEFEGDAYSSDAGIPRTFGEALPLFTDAKAVHEVLGAEFCKVYGAVKETEYAEFLQVISPWEREHLLLNV